MYEICLLNVRILPQTEVGAASGIPASARHRKGAQGCHLLRHWVLLSVLNVFHMYEMLIHALRLP